jgi:transcriptional regulator with XRE-family HTH domain
MPESADEIIGRLLGDAREDAGLPQSAAARTLGAAQSRIAKLELGRRRLLFAEAVLLAQLYGVEISRFDPRRHRPRLRTARRPRIDGPRQ